MAPPTIGGPEKQGVHIDRFEVQKPESAQEKDTDHRRDSGREEDPEDGEIISIEDACKPP